MMKAFKIITFQFALIFLLFTFPAYAKNDLCDGRTPSNVNVNIEVLDMQFDTSLNDQELHKQSKSQRSYDLTRPSSDLGALYEAEIDHTLNVQLRDNKYHDEACIWYEQLDVVFILKSTLYVAKEHQNDSCRMSHYREAYSKALQQDQNALTQHALNIREKLSDYTNKKSADSGNIDLDDFERTTQKMAQTIQSFIESERSDLKKLRKEHYSKNAPFDDPDCP